VFKKLMGLFEDGSERSERSPSTAQIPTEITAGEDVVIEMTMLRSSGERLDMTGSSSTLSIKKYVVDNAPLLQIAGTLLDEDKGVVRFHIPGAATREWLAGDYYWDVSADVGGLHMMAVRASKLTVYVDVGTSSGSSPVAQAGVYTLGSPALVGAVVYLTSADTVDLASASGTTPHVPAIGVIRSLQTHTSAVVATSGEVGGYVGLTPGAVYYLSPSTAGELVTPAPLVSGQRVQRIGFARNSTTLVVDMDLEVTTNP